VRISPSSSAMITCVSVIALLMFASCVGRGSELA
jgi:hypothetical protein